MRSWRTILLFAAAYLFAASARAETVENKTYVSGEVATVSDSVIGTGANVTVAAGAHVTFQASTRVVLGPGFHASPNGFFRALIGTGSGGSADTTPPSAPGNLHATTTSTTATLSWTESTDNVGVVMYRIRRTGGGSTADFVTGTTFFVDSGLTSSTLYVYTVTAYDAAGNSASSSVNAATTPGTAGVDAGDATKLNIHIPFPP
jgi:hypothetical protein